ncbi:hypothetical protein EBR21_03110 [bacterium]|nr:hypothetical protein [bacterium]
MRISKFIFSLSLAFVGLAACSRVNYGRIGDSSVHGASDDLTMSDSKLLQLRSYVDNAGFPKWDRNRATCIILCESSGNPTARTGAHVGLFQINETYPGTEAGRGVKHPTQKAWDASGRYCSAELEDPQENADCAFVRLSRAGWGDWDCGGAVPSLRTKVEACRARLDDRLGH